MPSFQVLRTRLSVRFLSSLPVSLPQLFHRCFPSFPLSFVRFSSGLFCLLSAFFRPLQPASDYSAFCSFFSLLPVLPWQRFLRCLFIRFPFRLFPCFPFSFGTQLTAIPFSIRCLASQWLPQQLGRLPFGFRPLPLGFRFRFWLLSFGTHLVDLSRSLCVPAANFYIIQHTFRFVNNYFHFFANIFSFYSQPIFTMFSILSS